MKKKKAGFDIHQGHGDHLNSFLEAISVEDLLNALPDLLGKAEMIVFTDSQIPCYLSEEHSKAMRFILLKTSLEPLHLTMLIGVDPAAGKNELVAFYPEYDGAPVAVTLTEVYEWGNGAEATLVGTFCEDERNIAFFDTRYAINKGKYVLGETYYFRLAAMACKAEVVQNPTFRFEGEDAVMQRERFGDEQKYDKDGNPEPFVLDATRLVGFFQPSEAYPHVAEFRSPVFGRAELETFSGKFHVLDIAIARTEDDGVVGAPLIVKQSFFPDGLQEGKPVQGVCWLHGYRHEDE